MLQNITYTNSSSTPPASVALDWTFNDGNSGAQGAGGAKTGTGTTTVDITAVNQAPTATISSSPYSATEAASLSLKNTGLSVSDVDDDGGSETATLSVGEGILTVTAGGSGATVSNSGTSTVTIGGTTAQIDALLNTDGSSTVSYKDSNTDPSASTVLTLSIDDNGNTGSGGAKTASATATIDIAAVNDAPVLSPGSPSATTYVDGQTGATALMSGESVSDPDSPANFAGGSVTVAISAGSQTGDEIVLLSGTSFSASSGTLKDGATTVGTIAGTRDQFGNGDEPDLGGDPDRGQ